MTWRELLIAGITKSSPFSRRISLQRYTFILTGGDGFVGGVGNSGGNEDFVAAEVDVAEEGRVPTFGETEGGEAGNLNREGVVFSANNRARATARSKVDGP